MLQNALTKSCLTFIIISNFFSINTMGLKDIATSQTAKVAYASTALLGCSLLFPIAAKCGLKRIRAESDDKSYGQIIKEESHKMLRRFLKESLPISLLITAYSYSGFSPKINVSSLVVSTLSTAIVSKYFHVNFYQKNAHDYPNELEAGVRSMGYLINLTDALHDSFLYYVVILGAYNGFSLLKNKISFNLIARWIYIFSDCPELPNFDKFDDFFKRKS